MIDDLDSGHVITLSKMKYYYLEFVEGLNNNYICF